MFGLLLVSLLSACGQDSEPKPVNYSPEPPPGARPVYRFAVHPLYNPRLLSAAYQPLVDQLNRQLPHVQLELEASRDYPSFEQKYLSRGPAFLLPNPIQSLQAMSVGYHVIAMAGDAQDFRGIFIVRKDSGIQSPADLKGKVVSYPSRTALAAGIMPQHFLHTHGLNVRRDVQNVYVGSQRASIMAVYLGEAAAGATWPSPWRLFQKDQPKEAAQLKVIWQTESLLNNSVMVRDDVPPDLRDQIASALIKLGQTPAGPDILAGMETTGFYAATDASYDVVRQYLKRFEKEVCPTACP